MFLPVVEERDLYTASGQQVDDVNSVVEFIVQDIVMDDQDLPLPPDDEDNDQPHYFHLLKEVKKIAPVAFVIETQPLQVPRPEFALRNDPVLSRLHSDILIPPPKA